MEGFQGEEALMGNEMVIPITKIFFWNFVCNSAITS
jgi:hypothetical protein